MAENKEIMELIEKDHNPYIGVLGNESLDREPYSQELEFFKSKPEIGGMVTEDQKIILNPHSTLSSKEKELVKQNELARLIMMKKGVPEFDVTPEQQKYFSTINQGQPYGSAEHIRGTILGRIVSGDDSAQNITPQQIQYANKLKTAIQHYLLQFVK